MVYGFRVTVRVRVKESAPMCISRECTYCTFFLASVSVVDIVRMLNLNWGGGVRVSRLRHLGQSEHQ